MISQYLTSIEGIEILGIAGLVLSLASFVAIAVWAVRANATYITTMERLPLDDSSEYSHEATR